VAGCSGTPRLEKVGIADGSTVALVAAGDGVLGELSPGVRMKLGVAATGNEDVVRELALLLGLADNKVCAIDETWSGLRLVWRSARLGQ
jgi:hypothetical protein